MRHLILVVILVGAAFLGGAFINGPGLRWVQTQVLGSLGLGDEGEVASVDLSGGAAGPAPGGRRPGDEKAQAPFAPMPTVVAAGEAPKPGSPRGSTSRRAAPAGDSSAGKARARGDRPEAEPVARADDGPPPLPADLEIDRKPPEAPRDPAVRLATAAPAPQSVAAPAPAPAPVGGRAPSSGDGPRSPAPADSPGPPSLPDGLRPAAPDSSTEPLSPSPRPATGRAGDGDWGTLARKMQGLGISKFTIEGQPGGRVVFACLIPMAGRHAVSQRFEAEGEDAVAAARAALRRVALWRAAQPQDAGAASSGAGPGSSASTGSSSSPASPRSATVLRPSPR